MPVRKLGWKGPRRLTKCVEKFCIGGRREPGHPSEPAQVSPKRIASPPLPEHLAVTGDHPSAIEWERFCAYANCRPVILPGPQAAFRLRRARERAMLIKEKMKCSVTS